MIEKKEPPHVISRPWDGSHPPPAPVEVEPPAVDLGAIVLRGINAYRYLVDPKAVSAAENARLAEGANARNDAKGALRELVELLREDPTAAARACADDLSHAADALAAPNAIALAAANLHGQLRVLESMSHEEFVRKGAWVICHMRKALKTIDGEIAGKAES